MNREARSGLGGDCLELAPVAPRDGEGDGGRSVGREPGRRPREAPDLAVPVGAQRVDRVRVDGVVGHPRPEARRGRRGRHLVGDGGRHLGPARHLEPELVGEAGVDQSGGVNRDEGGEEHLVAGGVEGEPRQLVDRRLVTGVGQGVERLPAHRHGQRTRRDGRPWRPPPRPGRRGPGPDGGRRAAVGRAASSTLVAWPAGRASCTGRTTATRSLSAAADVSL